MRRMISVFALLLFLFNCSTSGSGGQGTEKSVNDNPEVKSTDNQRVILFFGNSLTAGYGLDMEQAFPALIQKRIDSLGYPYRVVNAGLSGETTASGKNRIDWVLNTIPDIFILELGANDGLRGLPLEETPKNLQEIIDAVRKVNPDVKIIITGMEVPPNLGKEYTAEFRSIFPYLAKKNNITLIPFLLEGVAGEPELNLSDGIHPNAEGHKIVAETVWKYLNPMLKKNPETDKNS